MRGAQRARPGVEQRARRAGASRPVIGQRRQQVAVALVARLPAARFGGEPLERARGPPLEQGARAPRRAGPTDAAVCSASAARRTSTGTRMSPERAGAARCATSAWRSPCDGIRQRVEIGQEAGHRVRRTDRPGLARRGLPEQLRPPPVHARRNQIDLGEVRRQPRQQMLPEHCLAQAAHGVPPRLVGLARLHLHEIRVEGDEVAEMIGLGGRRGANRAPVARHALADGVGARAVRAQIARGVRRQLRLEQEGVFGGGRTGRKLDHRGQPGHRGVRLFDDGAERS